MNNLLKIHEYISACIRQIPQELKKIDDLLIREKSSYRDLVTEADKKIEQFLKSKILERFPEHEVLGEESFDQTKDYASKNLWIVDPIDGTTNFVKQSKDFCTILSYFENGKAKLSYVYDIENDILYTGIAGLGVYENDTKLKIAEDKTLRESLMAMDIRRMQEYHPDLFDYVVREAFSIRLIGSSGLDGMRVISGKLGGYIHYSASIWDYSPFFLMAKELGLSFTDFKGNDLNGKTQSSFILATPSIHRELMDFITVHENA